MTLANEFQSHAASINLDATLTQTVLTYNNMFLLTVLERVTTTRLTFID